MNWLVGGLLLVTMGMGWLWWQWPKNEAVVTMCDVGQGDGIVVTYGISQLVVDLGREDGQIVNCLGQVMPFWDKNIEVVVVTHADSDHLGGLERVLNHYSVRKIITIEDAKSEIDSIIPWGIEIMTTQDGDKWVWGNVWIEVLWPTENRLGTKEKNDTSLVMRIRFDNDSSIWFAADVSEEVEQILVKTQKIIATDVLKVSHHGSSTATSKPFLEILRPSQIWVSVGKNDYSHPVDQVLRLAEEMDIAVLRTDQQGNIQWRPEKATFPQKGIK